MRTKLHARQGLRPRGYRAYLHGTPSFDQGN